MKKAGSTYRRYVFHTGGCGDILTQPTTEKAGAEDGGQFSANATTVS